MYDIFKKSIFELKIYLIIFFEFFLHQFIKNIKKHFKKINYIFFDNFKNT
jgi:hypothetical protein